MTSLILILIPLLFGGIILLTKSGIARMLALVGSVVASGAAACVLFRFFPEGGLQFVMKLPWVPSAGISFFIGVDGLNIIPILLTAILSPIIVLSGFNKNYANEPVFYGLMMLMQSALYGVFLAQDVFLYYLFWEAALIPVYFLCALYGGEARIRITWKFFLYTIVGSLFMLIAFIYLYLQTPGNHSSLATDIYALALSAHKQSVVFLGLFIAFAIKMPIFPFHSWQPDTYTESPTQGTMLLSGIMLKMGVYSLYKWLLPVVPLGAQHWSGYIIVLSVIGVVYGAIIAIQQQDIKRLLAYSSFSHVGLMSAGIFTLTLSGLQGGMVQMLAHGINVVGLFYVADILFDRTNTRKLSDLGGITRKAPKLSICFAILLFGSVALPLTNGFVGEFLLLKGLFEFNIWMALVAGTTIIFGAVYMLRFFQQSILGEAGGEDKPFADLSNVELLVFAPLVSLVIICGVYPAPILKLTEPAVSELLLILGR